MRKAKSLTLEWSVYVCASMEECLCVCVCVSLWNEVCICDLCMYVGEVYKCICVFVYVYKLLDDLNFPRDY